MRNFKFTNLEHHNCTERRLLQKISDLDSKILKILLGDGRTGYETIAELCEEPKNKVWKRCRAMEKKGILIGSTTQLNFEQLGYAALATLLISINAQSLEQLKELTQRLHDVVVFRQYNSAYNVRAFAFLKDLYQLDHIKQLIKQKLPTTGLKTYIWSGVRNISENLSFDNRGIQNWLKNPRPPIRNLRNVEIDGFDRKIIEILTSDGRATFTSIAKEIGFSTDTTVRKYNRLKESNTLKVTAKINLKTVGYNSILDCNISFTTPEGLSKIVVDSLSKIPDVVGIIKISGDYDLHLTAMVRDIDHSFEIQDQISNVCGVTKMEVGARKIPPEWPTPQQHISTF